jgi:hypothetical protein
VEQRSGLPIGTAAALVLVLIALVLGGGVLFLRRESAALGTQPIAAGSPSVAATRLAPTLAPTTPPTVAPATPTAQRALTTSTPVAPPVTPTFAAVDALTPRPAADSANEETIASVLVTYFRVNGTLVAILPGTPTPAIPWYQQRGPAPEPARSTMLAGYQHFWQVRAQALYTLDEPAMAQIMTGDPLRDELTVMRGWRAEHQAQRVDVDHSIVVLWANADDGAVMDTLSDRSVIVDTNPTPTPVPDEEPGEPTPAPTAVAPSSYRMAFLLKRNGDNWQVVDSVRIIS